ncbi:MAG: N-acetylmuramoyl-L-alanine amidase [Thiotrichales bacterium]|nr:MAG: N-acetylmuramoyl-L-alanine amidase [Thiotrichales bacterium]
MKSRLFSAAAVLSLSLLGQSVLAAELLSVRAGEDARLTRLVLVSDTPEAWKVQLNQQQLIIQSSNVKTRLEKNLVLPMASALDQVTVKKAKQQLTLESTLTRPMKLVNSYTMPHKKGESARFVIELANSVDTTKAHRTAQQVVQSVSAEIQAQKAKTHKPSHAQLAAVQPQDLKTISIAPLSVKPFKGTKELVVAIDPGHGGKDVGAVSASGVMEKDLTLAVAKELKRQIDAQPGMRAVLTRDGDYFVSLTKRPQIARELNADVFLSLHADSYKDRNISGASFYVTSNKGASSHLAKFVAAHSNTSDHHLIDGVELWNRQQANSIGQVAMHSSIDDSQKLGQHLKLGFKQAGIRLQHSQVQSANFMVLKNIDMPSVLVEMGFISNPEQDRLLQHGAYQARLASSLVSGLVRFVEVQPEPGVVYANVRVNKGDNLAKIAQRHGTSADYLAKANNLTEKSTLKIGQVLKVPVNMAQRVAMIKDMKG